MTGEDVAREAETWLGVRWRHQGRSRAGVDCGGLVVVVGRALGLLPPEADMRAYALRPDGKTLDDVCRRYLDPVVGRAPRVGDIALMRPALSFVWPAHLGLLCNLPDGTLGLIHSYGTTITAGSVRRASYNDTGWRRRTTALFSYRGLSE